MKLKDNITLEILYHKLKNTLASHIEVKIEKNFFYNDITWIEVNKNGFIGLKIFLKNKEITIIEHTPSFFARAFFAGFIERLYHEKERKVFKESIENYLLTEFYE
jgi:hypothetical protein